MPVKPPITSTLVSALSQPIQATVENIIKEYEWEDLDILEAVSRLDQSLQAWEIECIPPLGVGDLATERVLRVAASDSRSLALGEIEAGEGPFIEFKETLVLDVNKHEKGKQDLQKCKSDEVLLSSLKTIAAFLNSGGGTLIIGVRDSGDIKCISREYPLCCKSGKLDFDGWELHLRSCIEKHFLNGRAITSSINVSKIVECNSTFARIVVGSRNGLSFLKFHDETLLFIRAGNRTLSIPFSDIEQYFTLSRLP